MKRMSSSFITHSKTFMPGHGARKELQDTLPYT
jgi:hypothetical protein